MKRGTDADIVRSFKYASDPELATYRWHVLAVLSDKRMKSLYELLDAVKILSEDKTEKQEYLEYLIEESRKEQELIQASLEELKKEAENNGR